MRVKRQVVYMRIDGIFQGQNINLSNISDILAKLNVGDTVRAQVLDITANEMLLKLFDGTTFTASTMTPINAKTGDFVDFNVKSKSDNQIFLETAKGTEVKPDEAGELKKQLTALDIKPDAANMEVAKEIKNANLPLNKDLFAKVIDLVGRFKELGPAKAVFLASNNIQAEPKNIETLNQLVEGKLKVGQKLDELLQSLTDTLDKTTISDIEKDLASADAKGTTPQPQSPSIDVVKNTGTPSGSELTNASAGLKSEGSDTPKLSKNNTEELIKMVKSELTKPENEGIRSSLDKAPGLRDKLFDFIETIKDSPDPAEKVAAFLNKEAAGLEKVPPEVRNNVAEFLEKLVSRLKKGNVENELSNMGEASREEKPANTLKKAFGDFFVKIRPETGKDDINVKNIYKDMVSKLELIKEHLASSSVPNKDEVAAKIENLQNDIRFLNEINNHNAYVQIPLNIWDKNTTGELYVLKRESRKKKIDPENVTVFITLNTDNLGQVDSLISVNRKSVSVNMRVEDKAIFDVIRDNHKNLYNRLAEKGYKLADLKYRLIEEPANILNINEVVKKELEGNRHSVDLKI